MLRNDPAMFLLFIVQFASIGLTFYWWQRAGWWKRRAEELEWRAEHYRESYESWERRYYKHKKLWVRALDNAEKKRWEKDTN